MPGSFQTMNANTRQRRSAGGLLRAAGLGLGLLLQTPAAPAAAPAEFTDAGGARPFAQPRALHGEALERFLLGQSFFTKPWVAAPSATTARDGLGPHFNANTCASCHVDNGGGPTLDADGQPLRALVFKLTQPARHARRWLTNNVETPFHDSVPDPVYGVQIGINGIFGVLPEARPRLRHETVPFTYPDGRTVTLTRLHPELADPNYGPLDAQTRISLRQAPALAGLGLIEQVPENEILAWSRETRRDGIRGRPNWLQPPGASQPILGRFNWKASEASLAGQTANAAAHDLGLTNPHYPAEACQPAQADCLAAPRGRPTPLGELDLPQPRLDAIAAYVAGHRAPQPVHPDAAARRGRDDFDAIGCTACHRPTLHTAAGLAFQPYTDLLLHDLGEGLADARPEFTAGERDFRSAPLWGLGARLRAGQRFLHDARAASPEEAILWHGGEAAPARERFVQLDAGRRADLLRFLEQL